MARVRRVQHVSVGIVAGREGCLSIPGYVSLKVPRSRMVKVDALNQFLEPVQIEAA